MAIVSFGAFTACDTSSRMAASEKAMETQAKTIEALQLRVNELETKLLLLDFSKDQYEKNGLTTRS
jgi:hypothetical protein